MTGQQGFSLANEALRGVPEKWTAKGYFKKRGDALNIMTVQQASTANIRAK